MIRSTDKEYAETMLIENGLAEIIPEFKPLAGWISDTYKVELLNIIYDTTHKGGRPRLQICLQCERDIPIFMMKNGADFDVSKQDQIACQFKKSMARQNLIRKNDFLHFMAGSPSYVYKTDNIWVIYTCLAIVAKD